MDVFISLLGWCLAGVLYVRLCASRERVRVLVRVATNLLEQLNEERH